MQELKNDNHGLGFDLDEVPVEVLGRLVAMRRDADEDARAALEHLRPLLLGLPGALEAFIDNDAETLEAMVKLIVGPDVDAEVDVSPYRIAFSLLFGVLRKAPSPEQLKTAEQVILTLQSWSAFEIASSVNGASSLRQCIDFVAEYWDGD